MHEYIYMSIIYEERHVHIHGAIISCNYIYIHIYMNIIYNGIAHILKRNRLYSIHIYIYNPTMEHLIGETLIMGVSFYPDL